MSIKISYSEKKNSKSGGNLVLFADDKFSINGLKKHLSHSEFSYISDLLKTSDLKKNLFVFELNSKKKIILISIKNSFKSFDIVNLGAEFYGRINYGKNSEYFVSSDTMIGKYENFIGYFLHGMKLKSYEFKKYKTKKETRIISINVFGNKNKPSFQNQLKFKALEEGTFYARDLVSEPGNILNPDEYAKRLKSLKKEPKLYLWDYTHIDNIWAKNENIVANHLLKWTHFLQDVYGYNIKLQYLRDKEKREIDFVITLDWNVKYLIEVKTNNINISKHLLYYKDFFPEAKYFQIVFWDKEIDREKSWIRIISASKFFSGLI